LATWTRSRPTPTSVSRSTLTRMVCEAAPGRLCPSCAR
jgi:hypothetical protein